MSETFDLIFNLSVNLFQGIAFVLFCNMFLSPKFKKSINIAICCIVVTLLFVGITLINYFFAAADIVELIAFLLIMLPFSVLCHKGKLYLKIIMPMITFAIFICVAMVYTTVISVVFGKDVQQVVDDSAVYRYLYVVIANLTYVFVLYYIYRIYKNKINLKKSTDIIICFIIPILTLIIAFFATSIIADADTSDQNKVYLGVVILSVFVIAFSMFYLMHKIGKSAEISALNTLMKKEQEMYKSEIINQSNYIEDISRVKHEMKNKLFCIRELLRLGSIKEAQKMCEDAEGELGEIPVIFSTDNIYLNALLNMAYKRAVDNQIEFSHTIKSNLTDIEESDLISLLGNLIDNAIEALQKLKSDKYLHITIFEKDNYYMFSVKNSISASVIHRNPKFETTKTDKRFHGHGLKIVKEIVKKYNGNISFSENDNVFDVSFMLEREKI